MSYGIDIFQSFMHQEDHVRVQTPVSSMTSTKTHRLYGILVWTDRHVMDRCNAVDTDMQNNGKYNANSPSSSTRTVLFSQTFSMQGCAVVNTVMLLSEINESLFNIKN